MHPIATKNRTVGLLGGSFNPAHSGHLHITLHALNRLKIDAVWWLVSPHNPLKSSADLAEYSKRLESAQEIAADKRIHVWDIESKLNLRFSYQTIAYLKKRYRGTRFVWLMGADNLAQFHRWRRWQKILNSLPVAVFDRAPYSHTSQRSMAYQRVRRFLLKNSDFSQFPAPPAMAFIHLKRDPMSSTQLRKKLGKRAFLRHNKGVGQSHPPHRKEKRS